MKQILFACLFSFLCTVGYSQITEGIKHLENENYAAATEAFNAACKADSKNGVAHFWLGEVAYAQEDYTAAEKAYKKGVDAGSCAECYVGLGKLFLDKANVAEAEKNFELAKRIDKKKASTFGRIGDAYLYSKNPNSTKAIEFLGNARDMDPKNAIYWAHLGDAFMMIRDNGQAMSAYEVAIVKDPTNAEAYIKMARIWSAAKQTDLAIEKLEKAIELSPKDARPIKDLYELYIAKRQYSKVVPLLEKYIALAGTDVDAKVRLVKFLTFQAKDYERAISEGEKLIAAKVNDYTLHRWLAWSYTGMAKQWEAERVAGTPYDTANVKSHYCKGLEQSKKLFDAIGKDNARKAFPEDYDYWALAALKCGTLDEAAHIYRKYIDLDSSRAGEIYSILAKTYFDSTRYDQAINYYNRKMDDKPLTNTEEYYLGLSYYYIDSLVLADSSFARVLRTTPNYIQGYVKRAQIATKLDSTETTQYLALPYYLKMAEVGELDADKNKKYLIDAYLWLAVYHIQKGNQEDALANYNKVLALDPENSKANEDIKIIKGQKR